MIELKKTSKDKRSLGVGRKKRKKKLLGSVNVVNNRFYEELELVETDNIKVEFDHLVEEITKQGEKFYRNPVYNELKIYKSMIKQFIKHTTDNMFSVEHYIGGRIRIRQKIYTITKIIDQKLEALTKLIISEQSQNIDLLSTLDEIRGLLIDFYK